VGVGQGKCLFCFGRIETEPLFVGHFFDIEPEMVVIQVLYFRSDDLLLLSYLFTLLYLYNFLDPPPQFKSVMLRTIKNIASFRIGDIIPQHHQQFILLQLLNYNLTFLTQLSFHFFDSVGIVADKMAVHALLIAAAKNGPD
jgi:hypothetical protein